MSNERNDKTKKYSFKEFDVTVVLHVKPMPETFRDYMQNLPFTKFKPYCHPSCECLKKQGPNSAFDFCLLRGSYVIRENHETYLTEDYTEYGWEELQKMNDPDDECFLTTRMCFRCEECLKKGEENEQ